MSSIEVIDLTKRFGPLTAVDDVSFQVEDGEVFGFLGPNGAGKTTTINVLCTLMRPTTGSAKVAGYDVASLCLSTENSATVMMKNGATSRSWPSPFCAGFL